MTTSVLYEANGKALDADSTVVHTDYDWVVLAPTKQVIDPDGLALTSSTEYNASGDVTRTTSEGGAGHTDTPATTAYTVPGCAADDCTLFAESVGSSAVGRWRRHVSSLSGQEYTYDQAGRLQAVRDTVDGSPSIRAWV